MSTPTFTMFHANQCTEAIKELSLFRKIASYVYAASSENWIVVKYSEEFAVWVPEGGDIPIYDGMYDFTSLKMNYNKLMALVKLDVNLVHDVTLLRARTRASSTARVWVCLSGSSVTTAALMSVSAQRP